MNEQFDTNDDHRMYELEHLRSETTMIERPTTLPPRSKPGEVPPSAPSAASESTPDIAAAQPPPVEPKPSAESEKPTAAEPRNQISVAMIVAACIAAAAVFLGIYLLLVYLA